MKIRSITILAHLPVPVDQSLIKELAKTAQTIKGRYEEAGYQVQTVRLATDFLATIERAQRPQDTVSLAKDLEAICAEVGFQYVSVGTAGTATLPYVSEMLGATQSLFATCQIAVPSTHQIAGPTLRTAAKIIKEISHVDGGFGNLRFAVLANVPPGVPFFPAAYWDRPFPAVAIATESADLAMSIARDASDLSQAHRDLTSLITQHGQRLEAIGLSATRSSEMKFLGIDFSLAPFPTPSVSIGGALEMLSGVPIGGPGTLTAAATLTDAIQQAGFPHVGFCGLMLPVLEDSVLAQRSAEGSLRLYDLLQTSAVCGTGLDTVPLPGDLREATIQSILYDVAALSLRLSKPLTARLMPLPGKQPGDPVDFGFEYFAPGGVLTLEDSPTHANTSISFLKTDALMLQPYHRPHEKSCSDSGSNNDTNV